MSKTVPDQTAVKAEISQSIERAAEEAPSRHNLLGYSERRDALYNAVDRLYDDRGAWYQAEVLERELLKIAGLAFEWLRVIKTEG